MDFEYSSLEDFVRERNTVWRSINDVPTHAAALVYECQEPGLRKSDVLTPLRLGKEWLFELTRQHQPRTGALLLGGSDLLVGCNEVGGDWMYSSFELTYKCQGKRVEIYRDTYGYNKSDADWEERRFKTERYFSLPEPIRLAYYHRFDGLSIPDGPVSGIYTRLLPFPIGRPWRSVNRVLESFGYKGKKREQWLDFIADAIPGARPEQKGEAWTNFMQFLDTRPDLVGREGTVFLVKNHLQDGVIYAIHDGDVANMQILAEPVEAIDRYCEQVLLKNDCGFDFRPYCVPL